MIVSINDIINSKIQEINDNINKVLAQAEMSNLEDLLTLELPKDDQQKYNKLKRLQKLAEELKVELERYAFLKKPDEEILEHLEENCNEEGIQKCAEKVFLYRKTGDHKTASQLKKKIKEKERQKRLSSEKISKIFKAHKPDNDDSIVEELNKKHATLVQMKEFAILLESDSGKLVLQKETDFKKSYQDQIIRYDGYKPITVADIWLESPNKRSYNEITFNPNPNRILPERDYNLWKGFAYEPKEGDTSIFKDFVHEVVCQSNNEYFEYVWNWVANMFQKPHENGETALVLKGLQGTGKNTFVEIIGKLLGDHFSPLSSIEQLLGRFDFHHANSVLIHANEAIWGGDKRMLGKLKTLITEKYVTVEQKHRDPITLQNCRHIIFSSNEDWPVHLDRDDRRFFVLELSNKRKEDTEYFRKIWLWANSGGYEALLNELLTTDISNFNFRNIPQSAYALQIKLESAPSSEVYIFEALKERRFCLHTVPDEYEAFWGESSIDLTKNQLYQNYSYWCEMQKIKPDSSVKLSRSVAKLMASANTDKRQQVAGKRLYSYELPAISQARKEFEIAYKAEGLIKWEETNQSKKIEIESI